MVRTGLTTGVHLYTGGIRDLNKKVESLETSLLGTDAMKTYKKAEKDVQSYLRPTKSSGRKEKIVVYSKK